jgi:hypothetical protein
MAHAAARIVGDAQAAIVLTRAGNTLALPGLPGHPLLDPGSAVLSVASAHLAARHDFVTFLCPLPADDPHGMRRITVPRPAASVSARNPAHRPAPHTAHTHRTPDCRWALRPADPPDGRTTRIRHDLDQSGGYPS